MICYSSFGNLNKFTSCKNCSQSTFTGSVRTHYCMDLTLFNLKTYPF